MLALVRKAGEQIDITLEDGRVIIVAVLSWDFKRHRARIGIEAPRSITVDRHEITLRKEDEVA